MKAKICGFIVVVGITSLFVASTVRAAGFSQNNIIDDSVFNNASSMSASAIDSFLNGFGNSCISSNSGFRAIDPTGYNPSSGYQYGGYVTAGQVIYDAGQAYGINPQVLISTLEKEQSLVTGQNNYSGYCNNGEQHKYAAAVGYGCPDSGTAYSYSGLSLYQRNGVVVSDTGTTCVNSASKAGFSQQVIRAAWLLKFGQQRSEGNTKWAVIKGNWNNSDDPQTCYGGPMTQGTFARCPSGGASYYDGYTTIDATPVHMDNGPTAALYWYTPHFHGNQNFFSLFSSWFGSTYYTPSQCDTNVGGLTCVWELMNTSGQHFYTTSIVERDSSVKNGLYYVGIAFHARPNNYPGAAGEIPTYRLQKAGSHFWTTNVQLRQQYLSSGWSDEGIAWYTDPSYSNTGNPIYKLSEPNSTDVYVVAGDYAQYINQGYTYAGETLNSPTKYIDTVPTTSAYQNVYRISQCSGDHVFTISIPELEAMIKDSCNKYEGLVFYAYPQGTANTVAVNRLYNNGRYIWTTSQAETASLASSGWSNEGIAFYANNNSASSEPVNRLSNNGRYMWTTSLAEVSALSRAGWTYEGIAFYANNNSASSEPVNRLSNNGRYIWTTSLAEVSALSRAGWTYEGIAFYAYPQNTVSTSAVNRLYSGGRYIWTTSQAEVTSLRNAGWTYEGIAFYVNNGTSGTAVDRLSNNGRYIWTTSQAEVTSLRNAGWTYEGIAFYVAQ